MQKDSPRTPEEKRNDIVKEYETDPDEFKERYDIPDDPNEPPPPSGDPKKH